MYLCLYIAFLFQIFSCQNRHKIRSDSGAEYQKYFTDELTVNLEEDSFNLTTGTDVLLLNEILIDGEDTTFILQDYQPGYLFYFNEADKLIDEVVVPTFPNTRENPFYLSVIEKDSIIYLDENKQSLVFTNRDSIINKIPINLKNEHPLHLFTYLEHNLKFIQSKIALSNRYYYRNNFDLSDSLMDERYLVGLVNFKENGFEYENIPIKPFYKKNNSTIDSAVYDLTTRIAYNNSQEKAYVYYSIGDTVRSYDLNSKKVQKHVISNSSVSLIPQWGPKEMTSEFLSHLANNIIVHKFFYDEDSGVFVRKIKKHEEGKKNYMIEIMNKSFEVIESWDVPDNYNRLTKTNHGIYLRKEFPRKRQVTYAKFDYPPNRN